MGEPDDCMYELTVHVLSLLVISAPKETEE